MSDIQTIINNLEIGGIKVVSYIPLADQIKKKLKELKETDPKNPNIKKLQVLKNGYTAVKSTTGRIYPKYKKAAKNSRWMTSGPNVQSITKVSAPNSPRACILSETGCFLASLDVSQGDVRIMAEYSGNPALIAKLNTGGDVHSAIAEELGTERDIAKKSVFATMYGQKTKALSEDLKISIEEARALQEKIIGIFEGLSGFKSILAKGGKLIGLFQEINLDDIPLNTRLPNVVATTLAQYIEHCIIHTDMWIKHEKLEGKVQLYIINHDELIFNIDNSFKQVPAILKQVMEKNVKFTHGTQMKVNLSISETNYDKGSFEKK